MAANSYSGDREAVPALDVAAQLAPLRESVREAVNRVLDSGIYVLGPEVEAFEQAFAAFCEARHCIAVNSGTSALHLALRLLDVGPGDEIVLPAYTFAATAWAPSYVGARPVFADIDPDTFNLCPKAVEAVLTERTRAVIAVHLYGHPADMTALGELCRSRGIALIEDAAQAHGALWQGRPVGTIGDVGCFSFYPTKNLPACGEGGALTTQRDDLAERCRALRNHGSRQRYFHEEVGYNYRMEAIQGAVLGVHLPSLAAWNGARRHLAHRYLELLADTSLKLPFEAPGAESAYHLFTVRHPDAEALRDHLAQERIGFSRHYPLPLHLQPCYEELGYVEGDLPVSEAAARECINLPLFPTMTPAQQDRVVEAIRGFFPG